MGTPADPGNVAWYKDGYRWGEMGSAVIAGHLDDSNGQPAAFWRLSELRPGDCITILDTGGAHYEFVVTEARSYAVDTAPREKVFGSEGVARLTLITCHGDWVNSRVAYSDRWFVFADLASDVERIHACSAQPDVDRRTTSAILSDRVSATQR